MSDHLPECPYVVFDQHGQIPATVIPGGCICSALRVREQRVLDAAREAVMSLTPAWEHPRQVIWRDQALAAIDALRGDRNE